MGFVNYIKTKKQNIDKKFDEWDERAKEKQRMNIAKEKIRISNLKEKAALANQELKLKKERMKYTSQITKSRNYGKSNNDILGGVGDLFSGSSPVSKSKSKKKRSHDSFDMGLDFKF